MEKVDKKEDTLIRDNNTVGMFRDAVYKKCLDVYGADPQIDTCLEEMSELAKALLKYRRKKALADRKDVNPVSDGVDLEKAREDIIDELADVKVMVRQMEMLFDAEKEVDDRTGGKIIRQLGRLGVTKEEIEEEMQERH